MDDLLNTPQSWQARKAEVVQVAPATVSTVKLNRHWLQRFLSMAAETYSLLINLWLHVWYILNHGWDFLGSWSLWPERSFKSPAVMLAHHCFGTVYFQRIFLNNTWNHFKSSLFSFPFCSGHFPPLTIHTLSCSFPRALTMRKQKHLLLFLFTWLEFIFLWNIIQQTITAHANLYDWVLWATSKTST